MAINTEIVIAQLIPGILPLVGVAVGLYGGYSIAKRRYAFEKVYEQKLICLQSLYRQIVNLEFELRSYVSFVGADIKKEATDKRMRALLKIKEQFRLFQHNFWKEEIILDQNIAEAINKFLEKYIKITSKLMVSDIQSQQGDFEQALKHWDESFGLVKSELSQIKDELKEEFRKALEIEIKPK